MKKLIILFTFLFSLLATFAQNDFTDEVYPSNGDKPYLKCKILEITHDNIVTFLYQDQEYFILNTENFAVDLGIMYRIPSSKK